MNLDLTPLIEAEHKTGGIRPLVAEWLIAKGIKLCSGGAHPLVMLRIVKELRTWASK